MNHSARFWRIVGDILPDYGSRRKRLREFQKKLSAEDW
jgi:predicted metal-dependent hydrolase